MFFQCFPREARISPNVTIFEKIPKIFLTKIPQSKFLYLWFRTYYFIFTQFHCYYHTLSLHILLGWNGPGTMGSRVELSENDNCQQHTSQQAQDSWPRLGKTWHGLGQFLPMLCQAWARAGKTGFHCNVVVWSWYATLGPSMIHLPLLSLGQALQDPAQPWPWLAQPWHPSLGPDTDASPCQPACMNQGSCACRDVIGKPNEDTWHLVRFLVFARWQRSKFYFLASTSMTLKSQLKQTCVMHVISH